MTRTLARPVPEEARPWLTMPSQTLHFQKVGTAVPCSQAFFYQFFSFFLLTPSFSYTNFPHPSTFTSKPQYLSPFIIPNINHQPPNLHNSTKFNNFQPKILPSSSFNHHNFPLLSNFSLKPP